MPAEKKRQWPQRNRGMVAQKSCTLRSHDSGHSRNEIAEFSSYTAPKKCQLKKNGNGRNEIAEWLPKSCGYHSTLRSHDSSHSRNEIAEFSHRGAQNFPMKKTALIPRSLKENLEYTTIFTVNFRCTYKLHISGFHTHVPVEPSDRVTF